MAILETRETLVSSFLVSTRNTLKNYKALCTHRSAAFQICDTTEKKDMGDRSVYLTAKLCCLHDQIQDCFKKRKGKGNQ